MEVLPIVLYLGVTVNLFYLEEREIQGRQKEVEGVCVWCVHACVWVGEWVCGVCMDCVSVCAGVIAIFNNF